ncbi:hypothetical protein RIF29_14213 [Crotalaria pallida]|uniref:Uncharacterized protein n=1 Tax=Crotalaria pallida TaxID=3830 RepID=A0AAN9FGH7_CROPI
MTRESGQRPEKLSLRKQLKLKCQEQSLNPVQNEVHLTYGGGADIRPIMTIVNYSQPKPENIRSFKRKGTITPKSAAEC